MSDNVITHIDKCLDNIIKMPDAWGSAEAIECQALLLLELKAVANGQNPMDVMDTYRIHCSKAVNEPIRGLLSAWLNRAGRIQEFKSIIDSFISKQRL